MLRHSIIFRGSSRSPTDGDNPSDISPNNLQARSQARGVQALLRRLRGKRQSNTNQGGFAGLTLSSNSHPPNLAKSFINTITVGRLSNFLLWYLYHDVVKFLESPYRWYKPIDSMDMRGWIALGEFLSKNEDHGMDLVVLDSVCDRLRLDKQLVHQYIAHVGDPEKMVWTQLALAYQSAQEQRLTQVETLELVQSQLQKMRALASSLRPIERSEVATWQPQIVIRIREFLDDVINPRINALREGSAEPWGVWKQESRDLLFLYDALQQPRRVPLVRYGVYPDDLSTPSSFSSERGSLTPDQEKEIVELQCELERAFSAASLQDEVRRLRARERELKMQKDQLAEVNEQLAMELSRIRAGASSLGNSSSVETSLRNRRILEPVHTQGFTDSDSSSSGHRVGRHVFPSTDSTLRGSSASTPMRDPASTDPHSPVSSIASQYVDVFGILDETPPTDLTLAASVASTATASPTPSEEGPGTGHEGIVDADAEYRSRTPSQSPSRLSSGDAPGEGFAESRSRRRRAGSVGDVLDRILRRRVEVDGSGGGDVSTNF